ncbi:FliM/FliN family flagellar motor switch protein [Shewanella sp. A32]|uniref:FliM/FliN family flagellar motor switch protein n=1 Tax=Shewanella sp. A32 TaxID=3031327 RepID=UPI0023B9F5ED|nr:FliM/FliN family flagellar motor switch protein [Shewanella sp. A32]MDF0535721.1 FliM/FliN family flagellar motor switch protein [Shewanella sp. A32]
MIKKKKSRGLIRGENADVLQVFPLTRDQRCQQRAVSAFGESKAEFKEVLQKALSQLISGLSFEVEMALCQGWGVDFLFSETDKLMMGCELPAANNAKAYMTIDHLAIRHLADLCLGGKISRQAESPRELTITELRIAIRTCNRLMGSIQELVRGHKSLPMAEPLKQPQALKPFSYLILKVRILLDEDVISWFLNLPVELFPLEADHSPALTPSELPLLQTQWPQFPVKGRVVMAEKKVNVRQLQQLLQGEFMPISLQDSASFRLGGKQLFSGKVAQEDGQLAFQVTQTQE